MFPDLEVPLRLKIVQDKFVEATQTGFIESQHYSLDISGFSNLKGMSVRHSRITCEVLCRIAELVKSIAEFQFVNLPVKMNKSDGKYLLSFYNDISK